MGIILLKVNRFPVQNTPIMLEIHTAVLDFPTLN